MKIAPITIPLTIEFDVTGQPHVAQEPVIKAEDIDQVAYGAFVKTDFEEQRYSLGLAYPALSVDKGHPVDGHRDFVRPEVLQKAAWNWMAKSAKAGLHHFNGTGGGDPVDGVCTVVESYLWPADDWILKAADGSEVTIRRGDWLMGAVWGEDTWPMIKSLQRRGWSPEGGGRRKPATPHALAELRD